MPRIMKLEANCTTSAEQKCSVWQVIDVARNCQAKTMRNWETFQQSILQQPDEELRKKEQITLTICRARDVQAKQKQEVQFPSSIHFE